MLAESELFDAQTISTEIDVSRLASERRRMTTFETVTEPVYRENVFSLQMEETKLTRYIDPMPFVPSGERDRNALRGDLIDPVDGTEKTFRAYTAKVW